MQGTVKECLKLGYTNEQSDLMGKLDDDFEAAIKLGLITEKEAFDFGVSFAKIAMKNTGKTPS